MELLYATDMIGVTMRADEGVKLLTFSNLARDIIQYAILIFVCNITVENKPRAASCFDQNHVSLTDINEMDNCRHCSVAPSHSSSSKRNGGAGARIIIKMTTPTRILLSKDVGYQGTNHVSRVNGRSRRLGNPEKREILG